MSAEACVPEALAEMRERELDRDRGGGGGTTKEAACGVIVISAEDVSLANASVPVKMRKRELERERGDGGGTKKVFEGVSMVAEIVFRE